MSEWYYMSGGEQHGPVTGAQLKSLAASGKLVPEDLVWNQTMTEWVAARRVRGLPFAGQAPVAKSPAPVRAAARTAAAPEQPAQVASAPPQAAPAPAAAPRAAAVSEPEEPPQPFMPEQPASSDYEHVGAGADNHGAQVVSARVSRVDNSAQPAASARAYAKPAAAQFGVPMQAIELFAKTRGPVLLVSFLTFLVMVTALAGAAFAALDQFDKNKKILTPALRAQGEKFHLPTDMHFLIVAGVYAFFSLIMMCLLGKYSSRIKKLSATSGSEDLENALKTQRALWRFIMLVALATVALSALGYLRYQCHLV